MTYLGSHYVAIDCSDMEFQRLVEGPRSILQDIRWDGSGGTSPISVDSWRRYKIEDRRMEERV
jgi:hypothetical protein